MALSDRVEGMAEHSGRFHSHLRGQDISEAELFYLADEYNKRPRCIKLKHNDLMRELSLPQMK